jgi:ribosomal protein S8
MNKLLIDEYPLMVLPTFAKKIGLKNAIFVQQVYFLTQTKHQNNDIYTYKDDHMWVFNNIDEWHENYFPFFSKRTLKRVIKKCEDEGYIISTNKYNKSEYDKTKWYRVNHEKISELAEKIEQDIMIKRKKKVEKAKRKSKKKAKQLEKMNKTKFDSSKDSPIGQNGTMPENTVFLPIGQNGTMPDSKALGQNGTIDSDKMARPIPNTTTYTSHNNKNKAVSEKIKEKFQKSFSKSPNDLQLEKIKEYIDKGISERLILKTIEYCGLGDHNQSFLFNRFQMLLKDDICTVKKLNDVINQNNFLNKNTSDSKSENKKNQQSKEADYKWKDFFIDYDKYKE